MQSPGSTCLGERGLELLQGHDPGRLDQAMRRRAQAKLEISTQIKQLNTPYRM
jgi:hypothetical protein